MPLENIVEEATEIVEKAERRGVTLRLLGGNAFYIRCLSARRGSLAREYGDIDCVGHVKQSSEIKQLFRDLGYAPRERFNALQGYRRLIFNDPVHARRVDIFLDVFEMCHKLDLKDRLKIDRTTIPLADLLATKLQIIEMNAKDIKDLLSLLIDHKICDDDSGINSLYLARLCAGNWGLYKTFTLNLDRLPKVVDQWGLDERDRIGALERVNRLMREIEETPKSLVWKMRAKIGERVRWYELPEPDTAQP